MDVQDFIDNYESCIESYEAMDENIHKFVFSEKEGSQMYLIAIRELNIEMINRSYSDPVYYYVPK